MLTLPSHLRLRLPSGLFPSVFPTKILYAPLISPYMLRAPLISFFLIFSPEKYVVSSTDYETPYGLVFSTPVFCRHQHNFIIIQVTYFVINEIT